MVDRHHRLTKAAAGAFSVRLRVVFKGRARVHDEVVVQQLDVRFEAHLQLGCRFFDG